MNKVQLLSLTICLLLSHNAAAQQKSSTSHGTPSPLRNITPIWNLTSPKRRLDIQDYKWLTARTLIVEGTRQHWDQQHSLWRNEEINSGLAPLFLYDLKTRTETPLWPRLRRFPRFLRHPLLDSFAVSPDLKKILLYDAKEKQGMCALLSGKVLFRWRHGEGAHFRWLDGGQHFQIVRWFNRYAAEAIIYRIDGKVIQRLLLRSLPRGGRLQFDGFGVENRYTPPFSISRDIFVADTMTGYLGWIALPFQTPSISWNYMSGMCALPNQTQCIRASLSFVFRNRCVSGQELF
jgi:hypothetical protein